LPGFFGLFRGTFLVDADVIDVEVVGQFGVGDGAGPLPDLQAQDDVLIAVRDALGGPPCFLAVEVEYVFGIGPEQAEGVPALSEAGPVCLWCSP